MTKLVKKLLDKFSTKRFGMTPLNEEHYSMLIVEFLAECKFIETSVEYKPMTSEDLNIDC